MATFKPTFKEKKGSLLLRSDHMDYGRATLVSNWHQAREAEPKDHDVHTAPTHRKLHKSTYTRIGNVNGPLPTTTCHEHLEEINLKKDFAEQVTRKPMISDKTFHYLESDKVNSATKERGFGSVLPNHPAGHNKRYLDSTYGVDYTTPYPYEPPQTTAEDIKREATADATKTRAYKKCHSQFTDVSDYRRSGQNTWNDESGRYVNTPDKRDVFKPTDTIPERLD